MKRCMRFLLLSISLFPLLSCLDNVDVSMLIADPQPTEQRTYDALRAEFAADLENGVDFTALRTLTTSQTYLAFLEARYPVDTPVDTLDTYFRVAVPDPARYVPFLQTWIANPTPEDIAGLHAITSDYRAANFFLLGVDKGNPMAVMGLFFEKRLGIFQKPWTKEFLAQHSIPFEDFAENMEDFAAETEKTDARWLQAQIETHGPDDGLLWSALYKPVLIGEMLLNFSETDDFFSWVETVSAR